MDESIGRRIRRLRTRRGLSQRELAEAAGRDRTWIAHVERGTLEPGREQVGLLAWRLGVSTRALCRGTGWTRPRSPGTPVTRALARFVRAADGPPPPVPGHPPRTPRTLPLLASLGTAGPGLWRTLGVMDLQGEDAWLLVLTFAAGGAVPGRLAPGRMGFPLPMLGADGAGVPHLRRPCLVRDGSEASLVLFGGLRVGWGGRTVLLPALLAASGVRNVFVALGEGKFRSAAPPVARIGLRETLARGAEALFERLAGECAA